MRPPPVIVNQLAPELGDMIAGHPSSPVVINDPNPNEPWRVSPDTEILVTGGFSAWTQTPADWRFPDSLQWVQTQTTGVEVFPRGLMQHRIMTCGRGLNASPIAEFVLAALLRSEKRLEETRAFSQADWKSHDIGRLFGRTLGLVGYGSIGHAIARRALAFDMNVLVYRRTPRQSDDGVIVCETIADVFSASDHLVIAAPLTPQTAGMIGKSTLASAKPGLHLVNISRGGLIDQEALVAALRSGTIGSATLDVTSPEPLPDNHPLYGLPNAFISPHISWSGGDQDEAFRRRFFANLDAYLEGRPLDALVDPVQGY